MNNVKSFFQRLVSIKLNDKSVFVEKSLKDLYKSPCETSFIKVYDFDYSKELIVQFFKITSLSSCDALKVNNEQEIIDFIELKSIVAIFSNKKNYNVNEFKNKIKKFNFSTKIIDSYFLLRQIVVKEELGFMGNDRKIFDDVKKRYIIVFDIDKLTSLEAINFNLNLLAIENELKKLINKEVNESKLGNILPPKIKTCSTIDKLYIE